MTSRPLPAPGCSISGGFRGVSAETTITTSYSSTTAIDTARDRLGWLTMRNGETEIRVCVAADGSYYAEHVDGPKRSLPTHEQIWRAWPQSHAVLADAAAVWAVRGARAAGYAVIAAVEPDDSGVGMIARVVSTTSGRGVYRATDEGGTIHGGGDYPFLAAVKEAEERARRAIPRSGRIKRVGYCLADYHDAVQRFA